MIHTLFWILALSLSLSPLVAHEDDLSLPDEPFVSSLVKTQNHLSTIVDSISVISGEWVQSETDFVVVGPEPLILNRCYTGDHAHDDRLGYNWDFNRPHKLVIDIQDKKTQHAKAVARLHHSSGIATIHASSVQQDKLKETIVPLILSRTQGLTNCRGEMSAKTNLHNTILQLDLKGNHCAAITGSGLLTYYEFSHQQQITEWKQGTIGVGHYKGHVLNHFRPIYERKPNGNTLHFGRGIISATNSNRSETYGDIKFFNEGVESLRVEASDGKTAKYQFTYYDHPIVGNTGELRGFFKHRFYLSEANFSHKPSVSYEYTLPPPLDPIRKPINPLLKVKRHPDSRFQEVEYYHKGSNYVDMSTEENKLKRSIKIDHEDDFRNYRVKSIKAPVGTTSDPIITHRFVYENDKHSNTSRKTHSSLSGRTKVYDAYLRKKVYEYNKEHRPTSIKHYGGKKKLYREEC